MSDIEKHILVFTYYGSNKSETMADKMN